MRRRIPLLAFLLASAACVDESDPSEPGLTTAATTATTATTASGGGTETDGDSSGSTGAGDGGSTSGDGGSSGSTGTDDSAGDTGGGSTSGGNSGDDSAGDTTGADTGGPDGPIALFAINEGNFNGDMAQGIWSIMTGCNGPSFDAYMATVAKYTELNDAKHFVTGWSCGATYALLRGYEHADVFKGIVHINQASTPYVDALEDAFAKGGETRVPVFIIHDFSYDAGGTLTIQWLESKGYQMGVDLFVMDRPGTGHEPYLTDDEKDVLAQWFEDL